jgi:hypothetical protein
MGQTASDHCINIQRSKHQHGPCLHGAARRPPGRIEPRFPARCASGGTCSGTARQSRRHHHHPQYRVPAHLCARDGPSARHRRTRLRLGGRKTQQVTSLLCKCPSRRLYDVRMHVKGERGYLRMGQKERGSLAWVSHNRASSLQTESQEGRWPVE